jgi:hypothetical protein
VGYTVGKAWDWVFGGDDDAEPAEPKEPKQADKEISFGKVEIQPIPRQRSFTSGTFFNGHTDFGTCDYDATSVATP